MKNNAYVWHGDGWSVQVLFSRAGLSTGICVSLDSGFYLLADCGDGTVRDLVQREINQGRKHSFLDNLGGILISHGHFDHVGGLHTVLGFLRMIGREAPLSIIVPRGTREDRFIIEAFEHIYPDSIPFTIDRREVGEGEDTALGDVAITPFSVIHCGSTKKGGIGKPMPALGYSLSCNNQKVVYTGDCGLDSNLEPHIKDADLLLIEATLRKPGGEMERRVHLSKESAIRLAQFAKRTFIIHRTEEPPVIEVSGHPE
jgi:ribonuclease Z